MPGTKCVSDHDLRAFVLGELPERLEQYVAEHLERCPDCESAAQRLDTLFDPALAALRHVLRPDQTLVGSADTVPQPTPRSRPDRVGQFTILEELGRGGMAVVYKARQERPERLVALKLLLGGRHSGTERRVRLSAEADALARLQHPHIVQVHEAGEHDGLPYIVLDYCPGGKLAQRLAGVPQAPAEAVRWLEPLVAAVAHAHAAGIVHRDLKPANVLLTADGRVQVSDFGLARAERPELTATGAVLGTPNYMAPEQAAGGKDVGPLADLYALGAILYEMLTGRPPFQGATALETLAQVQNQEPVPPRRLQPKVPRDLETICLKCLEKEPGRRYADAGALASDLARFREGRPVHARPVGVLGRGVRWARRNPGWAGMAVGIAALLAVFSAIQSVTILNLNDALQQSEDERLRAVAAELAGKHRLWEAYLAQAQARRFSGRPGQRFDSLAAIRNALALPTPPDHSLAELHNEAIACLVLADMQPAVDRPAIPVPAGEDCPFPDIAHGRYATVGKDRAVHLRHGPDGREIVRLENSGSVDGAWIVFSPDGRFLVHASGWGKRVKLWRLDGPAPAVVVDREGFLPAFRADSQQIAIGDARIPQQSGENGAVPRYAFSSDSKVVALSAGSGRIRLVEVATGRELAVLSVPESTHLQPMAFAPDNARLTAIGTGNRIMYTWDLPALRAGLRDLHLDWDAPDYPPPPAPGPPLRVDVHWRP